MGLQAAIAKKNRSNNSGGIAPDPLHTVNTLSIVLRQFNTMFTCSKDKETCLITFIFLWLTQALENIKSAGDIPSLTRVTGSEPCGAHRLRIIHVDGKSWVEYAQRYSTPQGVFWQWQPIPIILNNFFYRYVQTLSTTAVKMLLSAQQKQQLWTLIDKSWKTPKHYAQYGRLRKDVFFRYFTIMAQRCPYLSTTAKSILLPEHILHHASAKAYQKENSNQIRYKIFRAHNQYLERLDAASKQYGINLSINNAHHKMALLFDSKIIPPFYLNKKGQIDAFDRRKNTNNQGYQYIQLPSIEIGSRRALPLDQVRLFFDVIDEYVKSHLPRQGWTKKQLISYYNALTYQLAFQFLMLTGVRPTHALSLEKQRCYGVKQAIHSDKGRYRVIYLCDYLQESIRYYLSIQQGLLTQLNIKTTSPYLWFLLDIDNQAQVLNAKIMRQFMHRHWPYNDSDTNNIVPYCLRHTFAQMAQSHTHPQLTTQQIDRLMGHSSFGEHLGSDLCFPNNKKALFAFLNHLPEKLYFTSDASTRFSFNDAVEAS
ncbi:hypothetical protein [Photobacterium leiognathi]|uniref:hypothetical protein n=1 Tax=Photobacterium leiognathi TaxID=553611 RepID=UPI0029818B1B|nr:hypothetical protein [Photobacterium leiognathi]